MRLGILGSGKIVQDFLKAKNYLSQYQIVAICSTQRSVGIMQGLQQKYDIADIYTDYNEFLKENIDTVYIAVPNHLHYEMAEKALQAGKNVILEKPMTVTYEETYKLFEIAEKNNVFLFEAITNQYSENYHQIKKMISKIEPIHMMQLNFSQYSSRYDQFKQGEIHPVFDRSKSGGVLMDLNIYNLHFAIGILGEPLSAQYFPQIEKGVDTSGIVVLQYPNILCSLIASKNTVGDNMALIQGENGYIKMNSETSVCGAFTVFLKGGNEQKYDFHKYNHRLVDEFIEIEKIIRESDVNSYIKKKEHSILTQKILSELKKQAN